MYMRSCVHAQGRRVRPACIFAFVFLTALQELASVKWARDVDASASSTSLLAALVKPPVGDLLWMGALRGALTEKTKVPCRSCRNQESMGFLSLRHCSSFPTFAPPCHRACVALCLASLHSMAHSKCLAGA
eukprot:1159500-Pelagomonas_calceolata.AAC.10